MGFIYFKIIDKSLTPSYLISVYTQVRDELGWLVKDDTSPLNCGLFIASPL